ncbi:hypothetical protein GCM10028805_07850 [Spirosoma harenae]
MATSIRNIKTSLVLVHTKSQTNSRVCVLTDTFASAKSTIRFGVCEDTDTGIRLNAKWEVH